MPTVTSRNNAAATQLQSSLTSGRAGRPDPLTNGQVGRSRTMAESIFLHLLAVHSVCNSSGGGTLSEVGDEGFNLLTVPGGRMGVVGRRGPLAGATVAGARAAVRAIGFPGQRRDHRLNLVGRSGRGLAGGCLCHDGVRSRRSERCAGPREESVAYAYSVKHVSLPFHSSIINFHVRLCGAFTRLAI